MAINKPLLTSPLLTCLPFYYCCLHYIIYMFLRMKRGGGQLGYRGKQCPLNCKNVSVRCLNLVLSDGCRNPLGLKRDNDGSSCLNYGCLYDRYRYSSIYFTLLYLGKKVQLEHINTICTFSQTYTYTHTQTLLVFSGQLSREHSAIMSCSTFMTDGKCAARRRSAPPFPSPLHFAQLARLSTRRPSRCPGTASYQMIGTSQTRGGAAWS